MTRVGDQSLPIAVMLYYTFTSLDHQIPALLHSGYQVLYISCETPIAGQKISAKADDILKPGGAAEIVNNVLQALDIRDAPNKLIGGYDIGASIALRMAAQWPNRFAKVMAFHPSMGNTKAVKDEMAKIKAEVLV